MTPQEIWDQIDNFVEDKNVNECVWYILSELRESNKENEAIKYIKDFFKCDEDTAKDAFEIFKKEMGEPPSQEQIAHANAVAKELLNKPKCPICGSKNLSKYNSFGKALKMAKYGIFGMYDNGKTYICNNCGSKF